MRTFTPLVLLLVALVTALPALAAERPAATTEAKAATSTTGAAVNINTADVKELMTLDGIGKAVAEKIVQYRQTHGPFKKPEELRRVSGVGKGLWDRNRERVVVK